MKKVDAINIRKDGFALATVLVAIFVSTLMVTGLVNYSVQRSYSARKMGDRAKAITYSEAGLDYAYSLISKDFDLRSDADSFPATTYAEGSYEFVFSSVTSNSVLVSCIGYCGAASNVSAISILNYTETFGASESEAWDYAVFSGGQIGWSGSGTFNGGGVKLHSGQPFLLSGSGYINADIYSPHEIKLQGNAAVLDGDAVAPDIIDNKGNITGTSTEAAVDPIPFPSVDLTPYYQEALAESQVYNGDQSFDLSTIGSVPGGIIWVNGAVTLNGSGSASVCIIATGDIKSSASGTLTQYSTYPTLVSRDGDIKISSQGDYEGLIYVPSGDFAMSGSGTIAGQLMIAGNMDKSGVSSAFSFVTSAPTPPGSSESEDEDVIGISGWEK